MAVDISWWFFKEGINTVNDIIRNCRDELKSLIIFIDDKPYTYDVSELNDIPIDILETKFDSYHIRVVNDLYYVNIFI